MKRIAIVVATRYGQTSKIGLRIRDLLDELGHTAQIYSVEKPGDLDSLQLDKFDGAVLGCPVYAGQYPKPMLKWAKENAAQLNAMPTAFFSVSLNAADKRSKARQEDSRLINLFLTQTGLTARLTASLVGALHYRKYNFFIRWLLKRISKEAGGPTDTSRDHELTDWSAVTAFANVVSSLIQGPTQVEAAPKT